MNSTNSTNTPNSPRPPSVWIAQVIMLLLAGLWGLAALMNIYYLVFRQGFIEPSALAIASMISSIAFSILFFTGVAGLARRRRYGRWIAVGGLSLVFVAGVLNGFAAFNRYPDTAKALGAFVVGLIVFGPLGFLVYRLARGERANAFFSQVRHRDLNAGRAGNAESD